MEARHGLTSKRLQPFRSNGNRAGLTTLPQKAKNMTPKEYYKAKIDAITEVRRRGHYLPETLKQLGMDEEHLMEYTRLYSKECEKEEREAHLHDFFIYEYGMSEEEYNNLGI
jgi:hypothetical protein